MPSFVWISPLARLRQIKGILQARCETTFTDGTTSLKVQEELFDSFCYVDDFLRGVEAYKQE